MKKRVFRGLATAVVAALMVFGLLPNEGPARREFELAAAEAAAQARTVSGAFAAWIERHEASGGDRRVTIPIAAVPGLSVGESYAGGFALLDLVGGRAAVRVENLPEGGAFDVWLVDNQPGEGNSFAVDPGDHATLVGTLRPSDGDARVETDLGATAFERFEVDAVVVTYAGSRPESPALLYGMPSTFQRLYTKQRVQRLAEYAFGPGSLFESRPDVGDRLRDLVEPSSAHALETRVDPDVLLDAMVAAGAELFINETFDGNSRTCGTCHPASNNFTIDPRFVAGLPNHDPLFVNETNPALAGLEVAALLRTRALILENADGFDKPGVMRSVPHVLSMNTSITGPTNILDGSDMSFIDDSGPDSSGFPPLSLDPFRSFPAQRTGWGGDGSPGSGSLREFAIGAVIQHLPRRLARVAGVDFRLPTDEELDAIEVFMLALGRPDDPDLSELAFNDPAVEQGRAIFNRTDTNFGTLPAGKCSFCHANGGARSTPEFFGAAFAPLGVPPIIDGNLVFTTGVNDLSVIPQDLIAPGSNPPDGGFGIRPHTPGNCFNPTGGFGSIAPPGSFLPAGLCEVQFNPPPLIEAADTAPFFHNNSIDTIEGAINFYNSSAFNDSAGALFAAAADSGGIGIRLDTSAVNAIGKFLRVLNALENMRQAEEFGDTAKSRSFSDARALIARALDELDDAREVLSPVMLHPKAVHQIDAAIFNYRLAEALPLRVLRNIFINHALDRLEDARDDMVTDVP